MKHPIAIAGSLLLGLGGSAQAQVPQEPTLVLPVCPQATLGQEERQCFSVLLQQGDCQAASVGFTLTYATDALRLPGGNADVEPGTAVDAADQDFVAVVKEDIAGGAGSVQVSITPKPKIPIPGLADGEVARVCFTGAAEAPDGCTLLEFSAADVGDTGGQNCPMSPPGNGGIQFEDMTGYLPDHYQCYQAKPSRGEAFEERSVHLQDQFETRLATVSKPAALCNPADKDDEGVNDPITHLTGYPIKDAKVCSDNGAPCSNKKDCTPGAQCAAPKHLKQTNLLVENQLGRLLLDTSKADRLLVPGTKDELGPPAFPRFNDHEVDHFKCYKIKVNKNLCEDDPTLRCKGDDDCPSGACNLGFPKGVEAKIEDQFTNPPQRLQVKKPTRLCNPVNKNDEGIKHPESHLMCYQVKLLDTKHEKRAEVHIANQFGAMRLDTVKEEELCVPSAKYHTDSE